jgi:hypothetical protein
MSTGLMVTIGMFVLAGIFGLILLSDAKRTSKAPRIEKSDTALTTPVSVPAERFRRYFTDS